MRPFRKHFLEAFNVRVVVNFSALVYELFPKAISPAVGFFYTPSLPDDTEEIVYATPKPSPLSRHLKSIVLDTTEIKFLNRIEVLDKPYLWKIALWGTHRDAFLIELLSQHKTLLANGFKAKKGYEAEYKNSDKNEAEWLQDMPLIESDRFSPYLANPNSLVEGKIFHRHRKQDIYKGPLILIHHTSCKAAYSLSNVAFKNTISSIAIKEGQETLLKWIVCVINSPLTRYYQFMTSTRWAVERPSPLQNEFEQMPIIIPEETSSDFIQTIAAFDELIKLLAETADFFDLQKQMKTEALGEEINRLVFKVYDLQDTDRQLIADTLEYGVGFFNWAKRKRRRPNGQLSVEKPDLPMLTAYAEAFTATVESLLQYRQQTLNAKVYTNGSPLTAITFTLVNSSQKKSIEAIQAHTELRQQLKALDQLSQTQKTPSLYVRKHVRVYDKQTISLVRPSERRFWTQSQARSDADDFVAEMLDHFQP